MEKPRAKGNLGESQRGLKLHLSGDQAELALRAERLEVYSAWADDPERLEAVRIGFEQAIRDGLL
jgi:hypothetical protein